MAGTGWQSSDLLSRFNLWAGRPTADAISDTDKYSRLADGQDAVILEVANVASKSLIGAPVQMTSADGGYTWTFGTDGNGYPLFPLMSKVFPTLDAIPDYPWTPNVDYMDEGTQIRMPNNIPWSGTLYWYGITPPQRMSATVQPVLQPPQARILIVIKAVKQFAEEALQNAPLSDQMEMRWEKEWPKHATAIRKHVRGGGSLGPLTWPFGRPGGSLGMGMNGLAW